MLPMPIGPALEAGWIVFGVPMHIRGFIKFFGL